MRRIIWTRPSEDWALDQKIIKAESGVLRFPVTQQIQISPKVPDKICDFIVLTSRKAAEAFLLHNLLPREQLVRKDFLTFGIETYKYLVSQNLKVRLISARNGKDFAEILVVEIKKGSVIWIPRPSEPAFAVGDFLRNYSFETYDIEMYRTEAVRNFEVQQLKQLVAEPSLVCFASPSAVKAFVEVVQMNDAARFSRYTAVAIGQTTFASGQSYFSQSYQAAQPTLQSLWDTALGLAKLEASQAKSV